MGWSAEQTPSQAGAAFQAMDAAPSAGHLAAEACIASGTAQAAGPHEHEGQVCGATVMSVKPSKPTSGAHSGQGWTSSGLPMDTMVTRTKGPAGDGTHPFAAHTGAAPPLPVGKRAPPRPPSPLLVVEVPPLLVPKNSCTKGRPQAVMSPGTNTTPIKNGKNRM